MVDATQGILGIEWIDGRSVRFLLGGGEEEEIVEEGDYDEDESEGTQADAEFGGLRTGAWGSVDTRRRSVHASGARRVEGDDIRRHSMAV